MPTRTWVTERREWITMATAGLALALAIAALVVGLAAGGDDEPGRPDGFAVGGPPQGMVAPSQTMPGMPAVPGTQGYPDPNGSGSGAPQSGGGN